MLDKMKYILEIAFDMNYDVSFFYPEEKIGTGEGYCNKVLVKGPFYNYEGTVDEVYKLLCDEFD